MRFCRVLSTLCTCPGPERMRWPIESAPVATPLRTVSKPPLACPTTNSLAFLHCGDRGNRATICSQAGCNALVPMIAQRPCRLCLAQCCKVYERPGHGAQLTCEALHLRPVL